MIRLTRPGWAARSKVGVVLAGVVAAAVAVTLGTTGFTSSSSMTMSMGSTAATQSGSHSHVGTTAGWYDGHTVTFLYTKNYFCKTPPASGATSKCEGGELYTQTPAATFDPLYVVVPLFKPGPAASTLQCPTPGKCIDHPNTIDLSRVLGTGTSDVLLPAHSHVVATTNSNQAEWWPVVVVGVSTPSAWNTIVHGKSLDTVQRLQRDGNPGVTGNIPTNLFLFFQVEKGHSH